MAACTREQPNRCPYCGTPCKGAACPSHADLAALEDAYVAAVVHRSVDTVDRPTT